MGKRTNTAQWVESTQRWRVSVQKDGVRKQFYSSKPGRTGQREANAKADAWLDDGIAARAGRVEDVCKAWLHNVEITTSSTNYRPLESRWRCWVLPVLGKKRINAITDQDLQTVINNAHVAGKSKKTLMLLAADMRSFCKYCRKAKLSTYMPEDLTIPAGARFKGKKVLQPTDMVKLFNTDTTTYKGAVVRDQFINAYRFQVLTGLRPGELVGLRWADIHGNTVFLARSINVDDEETHGKNENAVRSFVMSDVARRVLDDQRNLTGDEESVFRIKSEQFYYYRWRIYCRVNELQAVSPYELRHTFVSVVKTLPAGEVKPLVGHSADMDTFGVYGHALTGDAENTAQAVNSVFLRVLKQA